ncbi:MAG TPA: glycosyl hydrolase, partial [Phycisphaerae bacterium]|nr:glycosyl hydrolase [Phycisphaerae bacterium]
LTGQMNGLISKFADEYGTLRFDVPEGSYRLVLMSSRVLYDGTHVTENLSDPRYCVNLADRDATRKFIEVTHEKYFEVCGEEFGKSILAFFTDEPSLIAWHIRPGTFPMLPWHSSFPQEFKKRYGYPIVDAVLAVFRNAGEQTVKRRCDFWEFIADQVAANYFGEIQEWCHAHGLKSSGHMLWEEKLCWHVHNYGSFYRCAKRLDWPGIDQLSCVPQQLMEADYIPISRLLASIADISGEKESFTEFSDFAATPQNVHISIDWIRATVNWHLAQGINNFTSYHLWNRYKDTEIRELNDYTARLSQIMHQGKRDSRVAVLYPEATIWNAFNPSAGGDDAKEKNGHISRIDNVFAVTSWELLKSHIDFDYVDDQLLLDARLVNGKLLYKNRTYECLILPAVEVLGKAIIDKIVAMLRAGVKVIFVGGEPELIRDNGDKIDFLSLLSEFVSNQDFERISATNENMFKTSKLLPRTFRLQMKDYTAAVGAYNIPADNLIRIQMTHSRILDDGTRLVMVANMGGSSFIGNIAIDTPCGDVRIADPHTGKIIAAKTTRQPNQTEIAVTLPAYDSLVFIIDPAR